MCCLNESLGKDADNSLEPKQLLLEAKHCKIITASYIEAKHCLLDIVHSRLDCMMQHCIHSTVCFCSMLKIKIEWYIQTCSSSKTTDIIFPTYDNSWLARIRSAVVMIHLSRKKLCNYFCVLHNQLSLGTSFTAKKKKKINKLVGPRSLWKQNKTKQQQQQQQIRTNREKNTKRSSYKIDCACAILAKQREPKTGVAGKYKTCYSNKKAIVAQFVAAFTVL